MLKNTVNSFLRRLKQRHTLDLLLQKHHIVVEMYDAHHTLWLVLNRQPHVFMSNNNADNVDFRIQGDQASLERLVGGEQPLQKMKKSGTITTDGSYRELLTIESLFLLAGPHSHLFKNHR